MKANIGVNEMNLSIGEDRSVDVDFDYYPAETATWNYPGCVDQYEIENAWWTETGEELTEEEFDKFSAKIEEALRDRRREYP